MKVLYSTDFLFYCIEIQIKKYNKIIIDNFLCEYIMKRKYIDDEVSLILMS